MFKGYDPNRKPPYQHVIYYIMGEKVLKTTYTVCRGYADSISVSSSSEKVNSIPDNATVEIVK
tara:strand:+ start:303 stop:491 length:189 start_codon:yes stop_codon:yes gene_type:complete